MRIKMKFIFFLNDYYSKDDLNDFKNMIKTKSFIKLLNALKTG